MLIVQRFIRANHIHAYLKDAFLPSICGGLDRGSERDLLAHGRPASPRGPAPAWRPRHNASPARHQACQGGRLLVEGDVSSTILTSGTGVETPPVR